MAKQSLWLIAAALLAFGVYAQNRLVSEEVYKGLTEAERLLEEKDEVSALNTLIKLAERRSIDDYERALVAEMLGVVYSNQGDYDKARVSFERVLKYQELSEDDIARVRYNLAQIHMMQENYSAAIRLLKEGLGWKEEPVHEVAFILASAYAALSEYETALHWIEKITANATLEELPDNYLAFAASLHLLLEHYLPAIRFLRILVVRKPDNSNYWRQLITAFLGTDNEQDAFTTIQLGYVQGVLKQEGDIRQLARFYLRRNLPYKAAVLLRDEIKAGRIEENSEIEKLLALAWNQAREYATAIPLLEKTARSSDRGIESLSLAHIYMEQEKWEPALRSVNTAISKGRLKHPEQAYLLKGIIQVQLEQYENAEEILLQCLKFENTRKQAIEWLEFIGGKIDFSAAK